MPTSLFASVATSRFGHGARTGEVPPADPRRWLLDQFARYDARPDVIAQVSTSASVSAELADR